VGRILGLALAALLAVGVLAAIGYSLYPRISGSSPQGLQTVRGVIGSEKQPFFQDPEVVAAFHKHGLDVQVDTAGSREIATTVDLSRYDFAFPAGVPAADKIKRDHKAKATYAPFYTPMAVGSFQPIAKLLESAGVNAPACVTVGDVAGAMREEAVRHSADLVVIGRGSIHEKLGRLRTHAYGIIRQAPCPVISV